MSALLTLLPALWPRFAAVSGILLLCGVLYGLRVACERASAAFAEALASATAFSAALRQGATPAPK